MGEVGMAEQWGARVEKENFTVFCASFSVVLLGF